MTGDGALQKIRGKRVIHWGTGGVSLEKLGMKGVALGKRVH